MIFGTNIKFKTILTQDQAVPWHIRHVYPSFALSHGISVLNIHWKDWYWNFNTLATWCEELSHWRRPWFWERSKAGGEWDDRGWDGWMASPTQWIWVWVNFSSWWWTGRPGMLQFMGSQIIGRDWAAELNWYVLHLLHPFICWWTFRMLLCLGHCKQCCSELWSACMF